MEENNLPFSKLFLNLDKPDFHFFELYLNLRKAGLPLSIKDYDSFLNALQNGFGIGSNESLKNTCKILWTKSLEEEKIFELHFEKIEQFIENELKRVLAKANVTKPPEKPVTNPGTEVPITTDKPPSPKVPADKENLPTKSEELLIVNGMEAGIKHPDIDNFFDETVTLALNDEYYPVTRRQMKQALRHLRIFVRTGFPKEIDLPATIKKIGYDGIFLEPVLIPTRKNQVSLLLLVDRHDSMVPFHELADRFIDIAIHSGKLGKTNLFYFHNCPMSYLYYDSNNLESELIDNVINKLDSKRTVVLILSDGGAARGGFNSNRIELTKKFINKIKPFVFQIGWLNPVPSNRWNKTSADEIKKFVHMFDMDWKNLKDAIYFLRRKSLSNRGII